MHFESHNRSLWCYGVAEVHKYAHQTSELSVLFFRYQKFPLMGPIDRNCDTSYAVQIIPHGNFKNLVSCVNLTANKSELSTDRDRADSEYLSQFLHKVLNIVNLSAHQISSVYFATSNPSLDSSCLMKSWDTAKNLSYPYWVFIQYSILRSQCLPVCQMPYGSLRSLHNSPFSCRKSQGGRT